MGGAGGRALTPQSVTISRMHSIQIGAKREERILVTSEVAINFIGMEGARVLSTPNLIGFLEITCRNLAFPMLEEGYDTVGTHVDLKHLAATPIGMSVSFHAEILAVDDRRISFRIEAFDEKEKVAEGLHERFIIHVARFAARLAAKSARS